jgi:Amt family ammonium transporter
MPTWVPYPDFVNPGDNAWQLTAATLVGLMSVPGLVVLYGGVMQKRWSVNSMMMAFVAFALVLIVWVLYGFKMAFGSPAHLRGRHRIPQPMWEHRDRFSGQCRADARQ